MILGCQHSPLQGWLPSNQTKYMVYWIRVLYQIYVFPIACWNQSLVVVWCVCVSVFDACHWLTNSLVEEGNHFIQWGILGKEVELSFICEPQPLASQRAHGLKLWSVVALWKIIFPGGTVMVSTMVTLVTKHQQLVGQQCFTDCWKPSLFWQTCLLVVFKPGQCEIGSIYWVRVDFKLMVMPSWRGSTVIRRVNGAI